MRPTLLSIILMAFFGLFGHAQTPELKHFTLEDLNFGGKNYRNMTPKNRSLQWWGNTLLHMETAKVSTVDKASGREKTLFTLDNVAQALGDDQAPKSLLGARFPYAGQPLAYISNAHGALLYDFKRHKAVWQQQYSDYERLEWNAESRAVALKRNDQLYVMTGDVTTQISSDGSRDIVYGESVHRDEFGIDNGTFWSPKGNKLAFYRMDQSMVADFPLVDNRSLDYQPAEGTSRMAKVDYTKYPMAGETSHKVTVGVFDIHTRRTVYLHAGDPTDRYFTNIAWSPDETTIYMYELNRDQNDCRLVSYDATTGQRLNELYRVTDERYVEPLHPIQFLPWDNSKFIAQSQRDGYNHLYLYNNDGSLVRQLTSGPWVVMDVLGFNLKHKSIIYASNETSAIQQNTWMVNVGSGKRALMDSGLGWHYGYPSPAGDYVFDNYSSPTEPRVIDIINSQNFKRTEYFRADDPWKGYDVPTYENGMIKAADGETDLFYRMVKPTGFDPTKKYPTIVYVYGGPHAHNVDARWHYASRSWETYMAQEGYLLFILDNRGSENRGKAFEQATFRQLGQIEMQDQMKGVEFLKSLPYVDADRMGVHGWSFGGYMTITLMTNHPDVFKVGVAGGPVIDWKWYEVMYGERYMDTPQANPEGYAKTSLLSKAKDLKGRLQIIIGENDPTVLPQHARTFLQQCIQDGTQPDYFIYPGEPHNMRGHQSTHLHERISRYFFDYLK